jgi:5'(3')-deoxyribonucleotidase
MAPMPGAIEALKSLAPKYELYLLSTATWNNPTAWIHKVEWVHRHFGKGPASLFYKRLILSHHKNLNRGDYLIDDRPNNGAKDFVGEWLHFGAERFPGWDSVKEYLLV